MTEMICIRKSVPNTDWPPQAVHKRLVSNLIRPSPGPLTSKKRQLLDRYINRLAESDLPGNNLAIEYLYCKYIKNLSVHTIRQSAGVVLAFLSFLDDDDTTIFTLTSSDISAFVEYEQDRGLKPESIVSHLSALYAFIAYLIEQEVIAYDLMKRKIRIQEPDALPKAISREDIGLILDSIASVRDRALLLLLLRTGMRIGELLEVKLDDIVLHDQKILIYVGSKNYEGRAVYYSTDAEQALKHWLRIRDKTKSYLFYGRSGKQLSYSTAWNIMRKTLERAGISDKGYSLHSLRHTFATDMLNAGMRVEVLQQLLGHKDIELTLRYARLSDQRREEDYYRAMAIIEGGGPSHEPYRRSTALQKVFEEKKLLKPHKKKLSE